MNGEQDGDWGELGRQWRARAPQVPRPVEIRAHLRRKRTRLVAVWALDIALALGLVALIVREVTTDPGPYTWGWVSALLVFLVIALAFSVVNRRGAWAPPTEEPAAYVRHGLRHCRLRLRTVLFAWGLFAAEVAFIAAFGFAVGLSAGAWLLAAAFLGTFTVGLAGWTVWFRRRVIAERDYLRDLEAALTAASNDSDAV